MKLLRFIAAGAILATPAAAVPAAPAAPGLAHSGSMPQDIYYRRGYGGNGGGGGGYYGGGGGFRGGFHGRR